MALFVPIATETRDRVRIPTRLMAHDVVRNDRRELADERPPAKVNADMAAASPILECAAVDDDAVALVRVFAQRERPQVPVVSTPASFSHRSLPFDSFGHHVTHFALHTRHTRASPLRMCTPTSSGNRRPVIARCSFQFAAS